MKLIKQINLIYIFNIVLISWENKAGRKPKLPRANITQIAICCEQNQIHSAVMICPGLRLIDHLQLSNNATNISCLVNNKRVFIKTHIKISRNNRENNTIVSHIFTHEHTNINYSQLKMELIGCILNSRPGRVILYYLNIH